MALTIPPEVADQLGFYVYLYIDPRSDKPFYVGKGQGKRIFQHLNASGESRKVKFLLELQELGIEPRLDVLAHGLPDAETALRIEAAVIDLCGLGELVNEVRGWRSLQLGRMRLEELVTYYAAPPVNITDPVLLIRLNTLYRHRMPADELYEITRGVWKIGIRREEAKYAFAVFQGVVQAAYRIIQWCPAGTTPYQYSTPAPEMCHGRWEFVGEDAPESIRAKYVEHSVADYFNRGAQNPIKYVNVP